jgi:CBS domain-containing protein
MKASDIMTRAVVTVTPDTPVAEACRQMLARGISGLPVVGEDGKLVGMITEGDVMRRLELRQPQRSPQSVRPGAAKDPGSKVAEIMTGGVITVDEDAPIGQIAGLLDQRHIRRVPVMRDGRLVGIVARSDLLRTILSLSPFPS